MPAALILLSAVPVIAGAVRLNELIAGAAVTPENARFFAVPTPVVTHIFCVGVYSVLGAFQFASGFRRRRPGWHRAAGRLLIPCGLVAALTGLWMTLFYPRPAGDGDLLTGFRLVFGTAMVVSILLGLAAIRRRDVTGHRAWMIRGYAIALGAGTQVLTHLSWFLFFGAPGEFARALLMGAGWMINLAVAEWLIRRRPVRSPRTLTGHADDHRRSPGVMAREGRRTRLSS
ncbi:DUF2306 domain-containing protein [Streptosporangium sp. CA-135522]|uniref:DUF2306 domain-containing protein n=1 Tax=Streptosporangium sp. CA-135522 TaxID=3240072 RepID=UPI003D8AC79E